MERSRTTVAASPNPHHQTGAPVGDRSNTPGEPPKSFLRGRGLLASLRSLALITLGIFLISKAQATEGDDILGVYLDQKQTAKIEFYRESGKYFGRIIWQANPRKDHFNPDPHLRERSLVGLVFIKDFVYDSEAREWVDGEVYAPDDGNTYGGFFWLEEGVLKMRGFLGFRLFGRTAILTPAD